ncbi:hypothetical protein LMG23994_07144 [Cupriavidus pinatubonensis]|uniref:DUF4158 domain-containing protein n=1 Tax=Cupriavidus pinatubonensis TaxID=248026 RepID=A0ABN7ZPD5_9BURK|nr:hypothetical protein LMG23994_07144 [Cupriavidus pinatubonensis]
MPRRTVLSTIERESLLAFPDSQDELIRRYTLNESDLALVLQRRGAANQLGFAVQLCYMRHPGIMLAAGEEPPPALLAMVAQQLRIAPTQWKDYGRRDQTRREHQGELQAVLRMRPFTKADYRAAVQSLSELAQQTDKGIILATALIDSLREHRVAHGTPPATVGSSPAAPPGRTPDLAVLAVLAAGVAYSGRNLYSGLGRSGQCAVRPWVRCALRGRHHVVVGRSALQGRRPRREHWARQSEVRLRTRPDDLHAYLGISTRHITPSWSTSVSVIRPTCSKACCTMSPICGSSSTTRIPMASPTIASAATVRYE